MRLQTPLYVGIDITGSTWLPQDLWPDIFKRLPVKTLCRFRCVCKWWNSLITSPFLINLHHSVTSSSTTPPHLKPYLQIPYFQKLSISRCYDSYTLYPEYHHHLRHHVHFPFEFGEFTRLNFTNEEAYFHLTFVDIIHGIVCLSSTLDSIFDYTILWNPAIQKYLPLPHRPLLLPLETAVAEFAHLEHFTGTVRFECHALGFCYDNSNNDFKVVRVWIPRDDLLYSCPSLQPMYEVYSTREGRWRVEIARIPKSNCIVSWASGRTGCFVNGTIHWIVSKYGGLKNFVLMFECESEEFTTVKLPKEIRPPAYTQMVNNIELLEYAGMLCALVRALWDNRIDMWAMEEHGVASSWKKLFRVRTGEDNLIDLYRPSLDKLAPYGPTQWAEFVRPEVRFEQILSDRVYEESMFLMDDTKAKSYANHEIVYL